MTVDISDLVWNIRHSVQWFPTCQRMIHLDIVLDAMREAEKRFNSALEESEARINELEMMALEDGEFDGLP